MSITDFIRKFPEIKEKNGKYYLFFGIVSGFNSQETLAILNTCLSQGIFKRKILLNKIIRSVSNWTENSNNALFQKVYSLVDSLDSYFKKESAALILASLLPYISQSNRNKLLYYFLRSKYKNNRKRAYVYLLSNWSKIYQKIVIKTWQDFDDNKIVNLLVSKMPKSFLIENFEKLSSYLTEEYSEHDFHLKILRNRFYARIFYYIPSELEKLKNKDPISFIFIMKECNKKIDPLWAIEIYKKFSQSHFLSRWYAEMGLWKVIFKTHKDLLKDI